MKVEAQVETEFGPSWMSSRRPHLMLQLRFCLKLIKFFPTSELRKKSSFQVFHKQSSNLDLNLAEVEAKLESKLDLKLVEKS